MHFFKRYSAPSNLPKPPMAGQQAEFIARIVGGQAGGKLEGEREAWAVQLLKNRRTRPRLLTRVLQLFVIHPIASKVIASYCIVISEILNLG